MLRPESMAVAVAGESVVAAAHSLNSHGGDLATTLTVFHRADAAVLRVVDPDAESEARWALSASGETLLVAKHAKAKLGGGLIEVAVVSSNLADVKVDDRLLTSATSGRKFAIEGVQHMALDRGDLVARLEGAKREPRALADRVIVQGVTPSSASANAALRGVVTSVGSDAAHALGVGVGEEPCSSASTPYARYRTRAAEMAVVRRDDLLVVAVQSPNGNARVPLRPLGARVLGRRVAGDAQTILVEAANAGSGSPPEGARVVVSKYSGIDIGLDGVDYVVVHASEVNGTAD